MIIYQGWAMGRCDRTYDQLCESKYCWHLCSLSQVCSTTAMQQASHCWTLHWF